MREWKHTIELSFRWEQEHRKAQTAQIAQICTCTFYSHMQQFYQARKEWLQRQDDKETKKCKHAAKIQARRCMFTQERRAQLISSYIFSIAMLNSETAAVKMQYRDQNIARMVETVQQHAVVQRNGWKLIQRQEMKNWQFARQGALSSP